jgi:hypothetical protein
MKYCICWNTMNKNANYGVSDEGTVYIYYGRINLESE